MASRASLPSYLLPLGNCQFLLRLVGHILYVIEIALRQREIIHEGMKYLFESDDERRVFLHEYHNLNILDKIQHKEQEKSMESMEPESNLSWGSFEIENINEETLISSQITSCIVTAEYDQKNQKIKYNPNQLLPIIPPKDYTFRLSSGQVMENEKYVAISMNLRDVISYYGLTTCLNSFLLHLPSQSTKSSLEDSFPHLMKIFSHIFAVNDATFQTLPSSHSQIQPFRIKIPLDMISFHHHYPLLAKLVAALGDTYLSIDSSLDSTKHLFRIQYECEDLSDESRATASLSLSGLYHIHTGRLVWSQRDHPDVPHNPSEDSLHQTESTYSEFVVDYPSLPFSPHLSTDNEVHKAQFTSKDITVTCHTTVRLSVLIGFWLPTVALKDACFLIRPFKSYSQDQLNISTTSPQEILGCVVNSLGFRAEQLASQESPEPSDYNWWSSVTENWSITSLLSYGLEGLISTFEKSFFLTLYANHPAPHSPELSENFFFFFLSFHLPTNSFLMSILTKILRYLFLHLQFYWTLFELLRDLLQSISEDLVVIKLSDESNQPAEVSWYQGQRKIIEETDDKESENCILM